MDQNKSDAQELANGTSTPWQWILAVAAEETQYGTAGIAVAGTNNFFGLHVDGQSDTSRYFFQISTYHTTQDGWVATFAQQTGFLDSGYNFMTTEKPWISGVTNWNTFATDIHQHGYGTTNTNYVADLTSVAGLIQARINCPPGN
jgi:flagellum-specific peptidoglycan hydrolase FlgJ